jgi:hypothetical protein
MLFHFPSPIRLDDRVLGFVGALYLCAYNLLDGDFIRTKKLLIIFRRIT